VRISSRILVGCIALLGFSLTAQNADAGFQISSKDATATITYTPVVSGSSATFSFSAGPNFVIDLSSGSGAADGLFGTISGTFTYSNITPVAPGIESATVTGLGSFSVTDAQGKVLTADLTFATITSVGNGASETIFSGSINLTNVLYNGTNTTLFALFTAGEGKATVSNTFTPGEDLTALATPGGQQSANFTGSVSWVGPDDVTPVPAPAGLVLLATAIPVLGLRRVLRRKVAVA
jgi:hypothetical protein